MFRILAVATALIVSTFDSAAGAGASHCGLSSARIMEHEFNERKPASTIYRRLEGQPAIDFIAGFNALAERDDIDGDEVIVFEQVGNLSFLVTIFHDDCAVWYQFVPRPVLEPILPGEAFVNPGGPEPPEEAEK